MQDDVPGLVLRPYGEIDIATVGPFRASVLAALADEPPALLFDLRDVTFLDSSGLSVLVVALKAQRSREAVVALVNPRSIVKRALELVGLDLLLDLSEVPVPLLEAAALGRH